MAAVRDPWLRQVVVRLMAQASAGDVHNMRLLGEQIFRVGHVLWRVGRHVMEMTLGPEEAAKRMLDYQPQDEDVVEEVEQLLLSAQFGQPTPPVWSEEEVSDGG